MLKVNFNTINLCSLLVNWAGNVEDNERITFHAKDGVTIDCRVVLIVVDDELVNCAVIRGIEAAFFNRLIVKLPANDIRNIK